VCFKLNLRDAAGKAPNCHRLVKRQRQFEFHGAIFDAEAVAVRDRLRVREALGVHEFGVPTQTPPEHVSEIVHTFPSLHGLVFGVNTHAPVAGLQEPVSHVFPDEHDLSEPGLQTPPEHLSEIVHGFPSLHGLVFGVNTQAPVAGLQEPVSHVFPDEHDLSEPGLQTPPEHLSEIVHGFPSLHGLVFGVNTHAPVAGLQEPVSHVFPDEHDLGEPGLQTPPEHLSEIVHGFPSLHGLVFGVNTQAPVAGLQEPVSHVFPDEHDLGVPLQTPAEQTSEIVHALLSLHGVPSLAVEHAPLTETKKRKSDAHLSERWESVEDMLKFF
jgi:hypothetical protein